ncbi:serine/threonine-protein kinase [Kocuria soli]|uniref:non-specific serine/threonine protein kinase n=2 Tax=Kocuria soli TaxID=2485125 RepID=A0A3N3ZRP5_9MICC|nr:serine/threonine-protein kinase [Kocuria soli]
MVLDGRYTVGPRMARGGTGGVYRAVDERLDRTVAVKIMHPHLTEDPDFVGRFAREARAAAQLSHPNVVAVLDQGRTDDGLVFLVMEFVEGGTLRDVLNRKRFLTPDQMFQVLRPLLAGLASAHAAGLVHRDMKPENVLMRPDGTVKVADFGLSRGADQQTATGPVLGTVAYAAPELVKEEPVDARSDVYSVGIMAWEMLAGKRPFQGNPWMLARAHAEDSVPDLSGVVSGLAPEIASVVRQWTAKAPGDRPDDAAGMVVQLGQLATTLDPTALHHVPVGWEQGPGPIAPVLEDPGASVLPDSAPATGPVEELRSEGPLVTDDAATAALPAAAANAAQGPATEALPATTASDAASGTAQGPATEALPADRTNAGPGPVSAVASAGATAGATASSVGAAERPGSRRSGGYAHGQLGMFDDTTDITDLTTGSAPAAAPGHTRGGDGSSGAAGSGATSTSSGGAPGRSAWGTLATTLRGSGSPTLDESGRLVETPSSDPTRPTVHLIRFPALTVVVSLAVTALLVALVAFLGWLLGSGSFRTAVVPTVQGTSSEQAQTMIEDEGFGNIRVYEEANAEVAAGTVIGTTPDEGTEMRVGEQVSVLVSSGPAQVSVPSLEGLTEDEASSRLDEAGLSAGSVATEFSDSPEGTVLSASPAESTQVEEGSSVDLTLSAGSEPTEVPNVVGSTVEDATSELEELGFTVEREDVAGARMGRVISQSQDGTTITLQVI